MPFPKATPSMLLAATAVGLTLLPSLLLNPDRAAQAHQVEIAEDIGATLHIEPSDTPRAGEEVLAWFALTRRGGQTIPLADCDCQLSVYSQPKGDAASLTPAMSPVNAEGYEDIPGARFTFPNVGAYTLVISGSPKQAEDFTPFELDFNVTVAAGQSAPVAETDASVVPSAAKTAPDPSAVKSSSEISSDVEESPQGLSKIVLPALIGLAGIFALGYGIFLNKNKQKP